MDLKWKLLDQQTSHLCLLNLKVRISLSWGGKTQQHTSILCFHVRTQAKEILPFANITRWASATQKHNFKRRENTQTVTLLKPKKSRVLWKQGFRFPSAFLNIQHTIAQPTAPVLIPAVCAREPKRASLIPPLLSVTWSHTDTTSQLQSHRPCGRGQISDPAVTAWPYSWMWAGKKQSENGFIRQTAFNHSLPL